MNSMWDGAHYHNNSAMQSDTAKVALGDVILKGKVLDIGCGSGALTAAMALQADSVIGIDNAESMILFAQSHYEHIPNLSFRVADATAWPFAAEEFDFIVSFSCLHWIKDLPPVIANVAHSLKKGGQFIACLSPYTHFLYRPLLEVANSVQWARYFKNPMQKPWYPYDRDEFTALLEQVKLTPLQVYVWDKRTTSKSRDDFIAFLKGWIFAVPHINELPADKKDAFIEEVADHFLSLSSVVNKADGSFEYNTPYLMVKAEKPNT